MANREANQGANQENDSPQNNEQTAKQGHIRSMTGFGRADGGDETAVWHWEIRTVNGRGRDLRLRLPPGMEDLEQSVRDLCGKIITRGNCTINLQLKTLSGNVELKLNETAFSQALAAVARAERLAQANGRITPPRLDGLLALRGVLEVNEAKPDEAQLNARKQALLADLQTALDQLNETRTREGARLSAAVCALLDQFEQLLHAAKTHPARNAKAISERLRLAVDRLLQNSQGLDEHRLHQEAILLATKADITEEIERLEAHCAAARAHLASNQPVGRRLEFLMQEFNREANTLCSKSNALKITEIGLEMKVVIDQMREQISNIE